MMFDAGARCIACVRHTTADEVDDLTSCDGTTRSPKPDVHTHTTYSTKGKTIGHPNKISDNPGLDAR